MGETENAEPVGVGTSWTVGRHVSMDEALGWILGGRSSLGDQLRCQDTLREPGKAFSVIPGPEEPAQAAHVSAPRPRHWAAHAWMLSHFCRPNSTVTRSAKHLPLGLPAQVEELWYVREGRGACQVCPRPW